jgi:uncharacterized protein YcbX
VSLASIRSLHVYPVKSCKGIAVESAELLSTGLKYDRGWMLVWPNGNFLCQRQMPKLALLDTALGSNSLELSFDGSHYSVPYENDGGQEVHSRVWTDDCRAIDEGAAVSAWLTDRLGSDRSIRLVRMAPGFVRPPRKVKGDGEPLGAQFADAGPYSVVSEASLDRLNEVLKENGERGVPMNRFRPNIVVNGLDAFAEHDVATARCEDYSLTFRGRINRCIMTTIEQSTAEKHPKMEPFKTLRQLNPNPDSPAKPTFAHYASLTSDEHATISVGDALDISYLRVG